MKLTSKGRYAVMAMADLAKNYVKEPISLTEISLRQGISIDYLEQLFFKLRKNNLVQSTRGPSGGYLLSKPPDEIKLLSIISAVDEKIKTVIRKSKGKHVERIEKLELQINLTEKTRDYNLGTSLRNYIDPRIFKTWTDEVGAEWEKLYTSALQKKFLWVKNINSKWSQISKEY